MANPETATGKEDGRSPANATPPPSAPPAGDVEAGSGGTGGFGAIMKRWRREDLMKRGSLALRGLALLFSLLGFIIMASNKHGDHNDWRNFDKYEEYRYLVAITILATLYTGAQAIRHVHEMSSRRYIFQKRTALMVDFFGDQVVAYLLISAASSAIPLTNRMREGSDNIFTDSSAAAISMTIFGFLTLGLSALVSGYKLSTQTYI